MEVSYAYELAKFALDFIGTLRSSDPEWQRERLEEIAALKKRKEILRAELRHELNLLAEQHRAALSREQLKQVRITEDYKQFLDSIDDMKAHILSTFTEMPRPLAFIIHHKAREMLDVAWHEADDRSRRLGCARLTKMMELVYQDAMNNRLGKTEMPTLTLAYINSAEA